MIYGCSRRHPRWAVRLLVHAFLTATLVLLAAGTAPLAVGITRAQDETTSDVAGETGQGEQSPAYESDAETELPPGEEDVTELEPPLVDETNTEETDPEEQPSEESTVEGEDPAAEVEEPTAEDLPAESDDLENTESDQPAQDATPDDPVLAATLVFTLAGQPSCTLSADQPAQIAHGGFLDYDCTFSVAFTGERLAPADIHLDWFVQAAVDGGWAVQLLPPYADPMVDTNWTEALPAAQLTGSGAVWDEPSTEIADSLDSTSELSFGLRVHRPLCAVDAQMLRLDVSVDASLPALADAKVQLQGPQPGKFQLTPELAPIPQPSVAFTGVLDFGEIRMTTEGPVVPLGPAKSVLAVTGLDQACGAYELKITSTPFSGPNEAETAIGLALASIDDIALPDGDCAFADGCVIATLSAGPDAAPVVTFALGVSLVLPAQPRAAVFDSSLTAVLELVNPDADRTVAAQPDDVDG